MSRCLKSCVLFLLLFGLMSTAICAFGEENWDEVSAYSEGIAAARKGDKWGFVDTAGRTISEAQWDDAHRFFLGVAAVKKEDAWGFIDSSGKVVFIPCILTDSLNNSGSMALDARIDAAEENYPRLQELVMDGAPDAMYALARISCRVLCDEYSFYLYMAAHLAGQPNAMNRLLDGGTDYIPLEYDEDGWLAAANQAAWDGDAKTMLLLGQVYHDKEEYDLAYKWLTRAYEHNAPDAWYSLHALYEDSAKDENGNQKNPYLNKKEADRLLLLAAEAGDYDAIMYIADPSFMLLGEEAAKNWSSTYAKYMTMTKADELAPCMTETLEEKRQMALPRPTAEERRLYPNLTRLAEEGDLEALYALGYLADSSLRRYEWISMAARGGCEQSAFDISMLHDEFLLPCEEMDREIVQWTLLCIEAGGYPEDFVFDDYGKYSFNYASFAEDVEESLRRCISEGNTYAMCLYAKMCLSGRIKGSEQEALSLYQWAAEAGDTFAYEPLAEMYKEGIGMEQPDADKAAYYNNAASQNDNRWYEPKRGVLETWPSII